MPISHVRPPRLRALISPTGAPSYSIRYLRTPPSLSARIFFRTACAVVPSPRGKPACAITAPSFHQAHRVSASSGLAARKLSLSAIRFSLLYDTKRAARFSGDSLALCYLFLLWMYSSMAAAAFLPAPMASMTVAAPVTASPPA